MTTYIDGKRQDTVDQILSTVQDLDARVATCQRSFGKSADQSGNNWAEAAGLTAYRCISGAGDYGADTNDEAKVFGVLDTPACEAARSLIFAGGLLVDISSTTPYILRVVYGSGSSTLATAVLANQYIEVPVKFDSVPAATVGLFFSIPCIAIPSGSRVWAQCKNATNNATLDFLIMIQELRTVGRELDV